MCMQCVTNTETLIISGAASVGSVYSGAHYVMERLGFTRVSAEERAARIRAENSAFVESLGLDPTTVLGYTDATTRETPVAITEFAEDAEDLAEDLKAA